MSSSSPGKAEEEAAPASSLPKPATPKSSLSDRVGFFEQVWRSKQRSRSRGKRNKEKGEKEKERKETTENVARSRSRESRVEVGYHGPRTDARDRSSEDPRRHRIPRASLSPPGREGAPAMERRASYRRRSASRPRERAQSGEAGGRAGAPSPLQHDDLPASPYRSISIKRTLSGRALERSPARATESQSTKPRALSFRVSPAPADPHQPLQPIFNQNQQARSEFFNEKLAGEGNYGAARERSKTPSRDPSISITQHIQHKVSGAGQYERPPPLPERPPRQRHSEPALYPAQPRTSTPRKPSTPYQLWREEHMKQELGLHTAVLGVSGEKKNIEMF